ncbi:MAG: ABC transporter permease [Paracoccaceae bacterium]
MDSLTWTGSAGIILTPLFKIAALLFVAALVIGIVIGILRLLAALVSSLTLADGPQTAVNLTSPAGLMRALPSATRWAMLAALAVAIAIPALGALMPGMPGKGIFGAAAVRFWPVWLALLISFSLSIRFRRRLGLYGKLMDSPVGMFGLAIVLFWVFTAIFADVILTQDPLVQLSGLKNASPGSALPNAAEGAYPYYLFGGDHLARDVFSRVVMGARRVLQIAPAATLFAFMVGITLGLPAGYFGGKLDTFLSFLANLVLAFPVILLFYLLVTPEIVETGIPTYFAAVLFIFPIVFLVVLLNSRYRTNPPRRNLYVGITLVLGLWAYSGLAFNMDPLKYIGFETFSMDPNMLNVFVSVVFVNSPGVFRIVRGLVMDIKARDYVAAAQTRGESAWYVMLWEILPNARGPLIVDFCLRIGYTTILLGTLGFFGLGVSPESPDWGSTIDDGRKLLSIYLHPALVPAMALMSLVLGLNLLADGLREESMRD